MIEVVEAMKVKVPEVNNWKGAFSQSILQHQSLIMCRFQIKPLGGAKPPEIKENGFFTARKNIDLDLSNNT